MTEHTSSAATSADNISSTALSTHSAGGGDAAAHSLYMECPALIIMPGGYICLVAKVLIQQVQPLMSTSMALTWPGFEVDSLTKLTFIYALSKL
eukprot:363324-Chlamydomonas_euryale.AAC.18